MATAGTDWLWLILSGWPQGVLTHAMWLWSLFDLWLPYRSQHEIRWVHILRIMKIRVLLVCLFLFVCLFFSFFWEEYSSTTCLLGTLPDHHFIMQCTILAHSPLNCNFSKAFQPSNRLLGLYIVVLQIIFYFVKFTLCV